jgi:hypothetical protein
VSTPVFGARNRGCTTSTWQWKARIFVAIALPFAPPSCPAQGITDENAFFRGLCTAFENHALRSAHIADCMVTYNEVSQSVHLRGQQLAGSDLEELCKSIGGTPAADGNLGMTSADAGGPSLNRPCQIALPERQTIRRVDLDLNE